MVAFNCQASLVITNQRIFTPDLNEHGTVFGGKILSVVDNSSSVAAMRLTRQTVVTATLDHIAFCHPFTLTQSMCAESYITGFGKRSIEVFTKIIGEDLTTSARFIGFHCFTTFVVPDATYEIPYTTLTTTTAEQQALSAGYAQRQAQRKQDRQNQQVLRQQINVDLPWDPHQG